MAESISEVSSSQELLDMTDEGKKKSKFRVFKNFFVKKKKRSSDDAQGGKVLKPSLSSSNIHITSLKPIHEGQQVELRSRSSMGNKALSHDSIFMLDPASERPTSQCSSVEVQRGRPLQKSFVSRTLPRDDMVNMPEVVSDTVYEAIYLPKDGIWVGGSKINEVSPRRPRQPSFSPPRIQSGTISRKLEETLIDDDLEQIVPRKQLLNKISLKKSLSEPLPEHEHSQAAGPCSCPSNTYQHADFSIPATNESCLDSSAARHKMALNPRKQKKKSLLVQKPKQEEPIPSLVSEEEMNTARAKEAAQKKLKKGNGGPSSKEPNKTDTCDQKTTDPAPNLVAAGNQVQSMSTAGGKKYRRKPTLEYGLRRERLPNLLHDLGNITEFSPSDKSEKECLLWQQPLEKQGIELCADKGDIEKGSAQASLEARKASEPQLLAGDTKFMGSDLSKHPQDEASGAKKKEVSISLLPLAERLPTAQEENILSRAADMQLLSEEKGASSLNTQCKMERAQGAPTICKETSRGIGAQVFSVNVPGMASPGSEGGISTEKLPQPLEAKSIENDSTNLKSYSDENSLEEKQTPGHHLHSLWKLKGDQKVFSTSENAVKEFSNFEKATVGYSSQFMRKPKDESASRLNTISEIDSRFERVVLNPSYPSQKFGTSESKGFRVTSISKTHLIPRPAFQFLQDKELTMEPSSYVEKYNSAEDMSSSEEDLSLKQADKSLKKPRDQPDTSSISKKIPKEECNVSVKQMPPSHPSQTTKKNIIQQRDPVETIPPSPSFQSDLEKVAVEWSIMMEQPVAPKAPPKWPRKNLEPINSTPEITSEREVDPIYTSPPTPHSEPITKPTAKQEVPAGVASTVSEGNALIESPKWPPQSLPKSLVKKEVSLRTEGAVIERRVSMESLLPKHSSMRPFIQKPISVASRSASVDSCIAVEPKPSGDSFQPWLTPPMEQQVSLVPENKAVERGVSTESLSSKIPPKPPKKPKIHPSMMTNLEAIAVEKIISVDHSKSSSQIVPSHTDPPISSPHSAAEEPILTKPLPTGYPLESSGRPNCQAQMMRDTGSTSALWTNPMEPKPANYTLQTRMNRKFKQHISLCPENAEAEGIIAMETMASRRYSRTRLFSPYHQVSEGPENTAMELENSMGSPSLRMPSQPVMRSASKPLVSSEPVSSSAQWGSFMESKPLKYPLQPGMKATFKHRLSECLESSAAQRSIPMQLRPRRHHSQPPMRPKVKHDMSSGLMAASAEWSGPVRPISPRYVYQSCMSPKSEPQVSPDKEALVKMHSFSKELEFPRQFSPSVGKSDVPKVTSAFESLEEFIHGKSSPLKHSPPFTRRSKVKELSSHLGSREVEEDTVRKAQVCRDPSQSFVKFMAQQIFSESPTGEEKMYVDPGASNHHSKSLLKLKAEHQVFSDWENAALQGGISFKKPHMNYQLQSLARPEDTQEVFSHSASFPVRRSMSKRLLPARKISKATGKLEYRPDVSFSVNLPEEWKRVDEPLFSPYPFKTWKVSEIWPSMASTSSVSVAGEHNNRKELLPSRNVPKALGKSECWKQVSTSFRSATFENSGNWFLQKSQSSPKKSKKYSQGPEELLKNLLIPMSKPAKLIVHPSQTVLNTLDIYSKEETLHCGNENHDNYCFSTNEMDDVENIFGVRLRKIHSSPKYMSEKQDHVSELPLQPLGPPSSSADKEQKIRRNASPNHLDNSDNLEPTFNSAEKQQTTPKSEGLIKKQLVFKAPGKLPGQQSDQATLEPDWITMAKQKQRNFPSFISMKELNITNTDEEKTETNEPNQEEPSCASEIQLKKILTSSLHRQEMGQLRPAKSGKIAFEDEYISAKKEAKRSLSLPARLHWPDEPMGQSDGKEPVWFSLAKKKAKAWSHMTEVMY
ncbi:acrosomal protein KIAA1210 homolog [Perognathus longimembris pacificus]|uniref:acrosomal protein KIAA1210 homolog n=1 Tax=Perognathus longimembris pacificus TaxID=214514 RepID=UPI0020199E28|nr:acrosomal protein KIAA1210 homolog [Perognathus longimembris pacificus]